MAEDYLLTTEEQIQTVHGGFRHLVILGAGASRALSLHTPLVGEKIIPLMADLVQVVKLEDLLAELPKRDRTVNFEKLYGKICKNPSMDAIQAEIEKRTYAYFDSLHLPAIPTIYDYLILSLRKKDMVASFNWDPLLIQAYARNHHFTSDLPELIFLHGNVAIGLSEKEGLFGPKGRTTPGGNIYEQIPILFPVETKDYNKNLFIRDQWEALRWFIETDLAMITIFGYSAPIYDTAAMSLISTAWGEAKKHPFSQFEFIDIRKAEEVFGSWEKLIHNGHHHLEDSFFSSTIARSPRRTGEIFNAMYMKGKWPSFNAVPYNSLKSLDDVWDWYRPLLDAEHAYRTEGMNAE